MDFENEVISRFNFLVAEKAFATPVIISDKKTYIKGVAFRKKRLIIEITNSSHPADYGCEIRIRSKNKSDKGLVIYSKAKQDQDKEFRYLDDGAIKVKTLLG